MPEQLTRRRRVTPWLWRYGAAASDPTRPTFVLAPFGGGSAYSVAEWALYLLADGHGVLAVQYPGRGPRASEPHATDMAVLANNATVDLMRHTTGSLVLVGHSLGATVCHEIAVRLTAAGRRVELLVVSAARPPGQNRFTPEQVLAMDRADWVRELAGHSFGADHLMDQDQVLDLVIPVLRADYLLLSRHARASGTVGCPVLAVGGDRDPWVTAEHLAGWAGLTTGDCATAVLPGGHFYYREQLDAFSRLIHRAVDSVRSASEA